MSQDWTKIEGMIIGADLSAEAVGTALAQMGVIAQLEWFPRTPQFLGVVLAVNDQHQAATRADFDPISLDTVAQSLATQFQAEVRLGKAVADAMPEDAVPVADAALGELVHSDDSDTAIESRIVEIGATPASSVPLLAALEGVDLGAIDLPEDHRALLATLPAEKMGWNFGDLPLVTLSMAGGDFQAFLVTDDHLEHIVTHNWGMTNLTVAGEGSDPAVLELISDRPDLEKIAAAVPGANAEALIAAADLPVVQAVPAVVAALGLPASVAGFLAGLVPVEETGAHVYLAQSISNAIGRSVDIMLQTTDLPTAPAALETTWNHYQAFVLKRPWLVPTAAVLEGVIGAVIMRKAGRKNRKWLRVFGGLIVAGAAVHGVLSGSVLLRRYQEQNLGFDDWDEDDRA